MNMLAEEIRNTARAIILKDSRLLLLKKNDESYSLPGGAHHFDESIVQGLQRECVEEIGTTVEIIKLLHVAEVYKPRQSIPGEIRHQIEFLFLCRVGDEYIAHNGTKPDKRQVDVVWVELNNLSNILLKPKGLISIFEEPEKPLPVYLGDWDY